MQGWLKSKAPGSGGGGGRFLSGWKDQRTGKGEVHTWMHTKCLPMTVWRHSFPMLIVVKDKKTGTEVTHVWGRNQTCHETEDVLDKLWWRTTKGDPSSARDTPPERCGMCKMAEYLWQQSWLWLSLHRWIANKNEAGTEIFGGRWALNKAGKIAAEKKRPLGLDPCTVLFDFVSEADSDENTRLHVGGFCGLFGRDELPDDLLKAMAAAKIRQKEAWKENSMVKPKSVMCVVDNDKPEKGVQISEETKELGEKVKEEITKVWEGSEIDIQRKPYCIKWNYDRSKNMGKQYTATPVMKIKPDARILDAIRGDAPDLSHIEEPFNQTQMRALFERHCKVDTIPWPEIFPTKEQEKKWAEEDEAAAAAAKKKPAEDDEEEEESEEDDDETEEKADGEDDEDEEDDEEEEDDEDDEDEEEIETDEDGDELVACDNKKCGQPHKISASKCPHCGHKYEVEEEPETEPEEEEKPPMRSRSEAKKAPSAGAEKSGKKSSAKKTASSKKEEKPKPKKESEAEDEDEDNQDDEIPF